MVDRKDWSEYYDVTRSQPPHELLVKALSYVKNTGKAIDIGGGALRDTGYLLQKGFEVTVIDSNPLLEKEVREINNERLHFFVTTFENFHFPVNEYILASAMHSLSYCEPVLFDRLIMNIKSSLKTGGIFCGQMLGTYDEWSKNLQRTYQTADEARDYLKGLEILLFHEEETEEGRTKHWHIFNFIARK